MSEEEVVMDQAAVLAQGINTLAYPIDKMGIDASRVRAEYEEVGPGLLAETEPLHECGLGGRCALLAVRTGQRSHARSAPARSADAGRSPLSLYLQRGPSAIGDAGFAWRSTSSRLARKSVNTATSCTTDFVASRCGTYARHHESGRRDVCRPAALPLRTGNRLVFDPTARHKVEKNRQRGSYPPDGGLSLRGDVAGPAQDAHQ